MPSRQPSFNHLPGPGSEAMAYSLSNKNLVSGLDWTPGTPTPVAEFFLPPPLSTLFTPPQLLFSVPLLLASLIGFQDITLAWFSFYLFICFSVSFPASHSFFSVVLTELQSLALVFPCLLSLRWLVCSQDLDCHLHANDSPDSWLLKWSSSLLSKALYLSRLTSNSQVSQVCCGAVAITVVLPGVRQRADLSSVTFQA